MASAWKTIRQVPTKEAPRPVEGTPALQPAQTLEADLDRRWPAVSTVAPAQGGQHPDSPSAIRTQPEPLLVHNLLNDLTGLGSLLLRELREGSWLNAYLLAAGMNQIVEDYLHPDPYFLGKAADYLARIRRPAGLLAAGTARGIATAMARIHSHQRPTRYLLDWHADLAAFVQRLADIVACPPAATTAPREALVAWGDVLLRSLGRFPAHLRREVLRLWVVGCSYRGLPETIASVRNPYGGCCCIRRDVLLAAGGFRRGPGCNGIHPTGCHETELCIRALKRWPSGIFLFDPQARIYHKVPVNRTTWTYFRNRCFAEGLSQAWVSQLVGPRDALSSERAYVCLVLPEAVAKALDDALTCRDPRGATHALAIITRLFFTAAGYAAGGLHHVTDWDDDATLQASSTA